MQSQVNNSPAELVAILRAARTAGDRSLERVAKDELRERFNIEVRFLPLRKPRDKREELAHAE